MLTAKKLNDSNPYAHRDELDWLTSAAKSLPDGSVCVMLGAGPGVLALALFEGNPTLDIFVVDNVATNYTEEHVKYAGYWANYILKDSAVAGEEWGDVQVDMLIVDADHSYEAVCKDIKAWWKHVKIGGSFFFHDVWEREGGFRGTGDWELSGVYEVLYEMKRTDFELEAVVGISRVYRKTGTYANFCVE